MKRLIIISAILLFLNISCQLEPVGQIQPTDNSVPNNLPEEIIPQFRLIKQETFDITNTLTTTGLYEYYPNNVLQKLTYMYPELGKYLYSYNSQGHVGKIEGFDMDEILTSTYTYANIYNNDNLLIKIVTLDSNDVIQNSVVQTYDHLNRISERITYNENQIQTSKIVYDYTLDFTVIYQYDPSNTLLNSQKQYFDNYGFLILNQNYDSVGNLISNYSRIYTRNNFGRVI